MCGREGVALVPDEPRTESTLFRTSTPGVPPTFLTLGPGVSTLVGLLDFCVSSSRKARASAASPGAASMPGVDRPVADFVRNAGGFD